MKRIIYALAALALILGLTFAPSAPAASAATATATQSCGDTYTVQRGDYLTMIAKKCGTTVENIIKLNPSIKNASLIYPNQVLRLTGTAPTATPVPTTTPVSSGTYVVVKGDTLTKIATRFGTTVTEMLKVNPEVKNASIIYVGQKLRLPTTATSPSGAKVSLSVLTAKVNDQVSVSVSGFPKNAAIDMRLGKQGEAHSVVIDSATDANGAASAKMTIPATAKAGEKWVITVLTTELAKTVTVTSSVITIQ